MYVRARQPQANHCNNNIYISVYVYIYGHGGSHLKDTQHCRIALVRSDEPATSQPASSAIQTMCVVHKNAVDCYESTHEKKIHSLAAAWILCV